MTTICDVNFDVVAFHVYRWKKNNFDVCIRSVIVGKKKDEKKTICKQLKTMEKKKKETLVSVGTKNRSLVPVDTENRSLIPVISPGPKDGYLHLYSRFAIRDYRGCKSGLLWVSSVVNMLVNCLSVRFSSKLVIDDGEYDLKSGNSTHPLY